MSHTFVSVAARLAEGAGVNEGAPNPYVIGGGVLVVLLLALGAVAAFGGGREHS